MTELESRLKEMQDGASNRHEELATALSKVRDDLSNRIKEAQTRTKQ